MGSVDEGGNSHPPNATVRQPAGDGRLARAVRISWQPRDTHWWLTALAGVGVAIAAAMALFGLPPVDLHGPLHRIGIMDPSCGGTQAARYTAQGRLIEAWRYNPLGILTVLVAAGVLARCVVGFSTGSWATLSVAWTPRRRRIAFLGLLLLLTALEIRQQLRADLLTAGT